MSRKAEATYHGADIVTRLRACGPESDYDGVMQEAASEIEGLRAGRLIETLDELDELPNGSIVLSKVYKGRHGYPFAFQKLYEGDWYRGGRSGGTHPDYFLPAIVLHEAAL